MPEAASGTSVEPDPTHYDELYGRCRALAEFEMSRLARASSAWTEARPGGGGDTRSAGALAAR